MDKFRRPGAAREPAVRPFATRSDSIQGLAADKRRALQDRLEAQIRDTVYPAYHRLIDYEHHLETVATDDDGVWKLPNGDAFYDQCLRSQTTTDMSADSIHSLGLRQVASLQSEMSRSFRPTASGPRMSARRCPARQGRALSFPGRRQRARRRSWRGTARSWTKRQAHEHAVRPAPELSGVVVKRVPAFKEATSPGAYTSRPPSRCAPGNVLRQPARPAETNRNEMRTARLSRGDPGAPLPDRIQQDLKGVPFFRRVLPFTAYAEGWGLYAERLAYESGFSPHRHTIRWARSRRSCSGRCAVVDTGSIAEALDAAGSDRLHGHTPGWPRPRCHRDRALHRQPRPGLRAYKVGQLRDHRAARARQTATGARFDIRRFQTWCSRTGRCRSTCSTGWWTTGSRTSSSTRLRSSADRAHA